MYVTNAILSKWLAGYSIVIAEERRRQVKLRVITYILAFESCVLMHTVGI